MAPPRKATALVRGLDAALADLAALFPHGALTMETDPAEFIRSVISEIERQRRHASRDERLKRAIRAFTVDAYTATGEHAPNGPAETAWLRLSILLLALPGATGQQVARLVSEYLAADIERLGDLRIAAEAVYGEDMRTPQSVEGYH